MYKEFRNDLPVLDGSQRECTKCKAINELDQHISDAIAERNRHVGVTAWCQACREEARLKRQIREQGYTEEEGDDTETQSVISETYTEEHMSDGDYVPSEEGSDSDDYQFSDGDYMDSSDYDSDRDFYHY